MDRSMHGSFIYILVVAGGFCAISAKSLQFPKDVSVVERLVLEPIFNQKIPADPFDTYDYNEGVPNQFYQPQSLPSTVAAPLSEKTAEAATKARANSLLAAASLLSSILSIEAKSHPGFNHPRHPSANPYFALLLSHYGRYVPLCGGGRPGIYSHNAANNYHNNKPFGAYKIYEDADA